MPNAREGSLITRADREAAASILQTSSPQVGINLLDRQRFYEEIMSGQHDEISIIQAMARHRIAAERAARQEGVTRGLNAAAALVRSHARLTGAFTAYRLSGDDVEAAIIALTPEQVLQDPTDRANAPPLAGTERVAGIRYA